MTESFGMMNGAFFVGKNEILKWVNISLKLNLTKIEQACTGAVYCQIIDSIHSGKVKMHKVNWKAKLEHEYISNYKILQQAFDDCKITKRIEVEKLIKGKYQDNLEFLQWMKRYYEEKSATTDYDPIARRNNCDLEITNENLTAGNVQKKRDTSKTQSVTSNALKSVKSDKNLASTGSTHSINLKTIKTEINNKENITEIPHKNKSVSIPNENEEKVAEILVLNDQKENSCKNNL
jgi:RP/EB family microtubule-associated protein